MRRILAACTDSGDVVWEPFGGLCTATVAAVEMGRVGFAAEPVTDFYELALRRLQETAERSPDARDSCGEAP
jgi:DNA modification methylase